METKLYPDAVETVTQYKPVLAEKRDRKYKAKYLRAEASDKRSKTIAWCLFGLLILMAVVMAWTIRGNATLQQRLNDSKTMPSGRLK